MLGANWSLNFSEFSIRVNDNFFKKENLWIDKMLKFIGKSYIESIR